MFTLNIGTTESFDESTQEFVEVGGFSLEFEHSLVSLSKWESEFEKPFLGKEPKTDQETLAYIDCMLLTENPPEDWISQLSRDQFDALSKYIEAGRTATTFNDRKQAPSREVITSELIYYWMVSAAIPIECENWHLNRLFTLIRVFSAKNESPKKMSKSEIAARNRELNAQRRKELGTTG